MIPEYRMYWFDTEDMAATRAFYEAATDSGYPMAVWSDPEFMDMIRGSFRYQSRLVGLRVRAFAHRLAVYGNPE